MNVLTGAGQPKGQFGCVVVIGIFLELVVGNA
jgi:hypothetical protein